MGNGKLNETTRKDDSSKSKYFICERLSNDHRLFCHNSCSFCSIKNDSKLTSCACIIGNIEKHCKSADEKVTLSYTSEKMSTTHEVFTDKNKKSKKATKSKNLNIEKISFI